MAGKKPRLTLIAGQGMTQRAVAEETAMELAVVREEAHAHLARMRLTLQRSFWSDEVFAAVRRPLLAELDRYERQLAVDEGRAA